MENRIYYKIINTALILIITFLFFAVIVSQIGLYFEGTRQVFTSIDTLEGVNAADIIDTVGGGEVQLTLEGTAPGETIMILINGQKSAFFDKERITLAVKNNSLIEIDATAEGAPFFVTITDVSPSIDPKCLGIKAFVDRNIAILGKIFTK